MSAPDPTPPPVAAVSPDFAAIFDAVPSPLLVIAPPDWTIVAANEARLAATGTTRDEIVGRRLFDAFPDDPDDPDADGVRNLTASLDRVTRSGTSDVMAVQRYPLRDATGAFVERWWSPVNTPVPGPDGTVAYVIHRVEDVTEIVRMRGAAASADQLARDQQAVIDRLRRTGTALAESGEALRRNEHRLAAALAVTRLGTFEWDLATDAIRLDDRARALFGFGPSEGTGAAELFARIHPDDADAVLARVREAEARGERLETEYRLHLPDGTERCVRSISDAVSGAEGRAARMVGVLDDVTRARQASDLVSASDARYRTLFDAIEVGFCVIDMIFDDQGRAIDYLFVEANPIFAAQAGFDDPVGKRVLDMLPNIERRWIELYGAVATTGRSARLEEGSAVLGRWWDVHAFRVGGAESRRVGVLFSDISDRRRAELALRDLNATLEQRVEERTAERDRVWRNSRELLGVADGEGRWLSVNPAWQRVLGWTPDEVIGRTSEWLEHPEDREKTRAEVAHLANGRATLAFENRYRRKDGEHVWLSWTAMPGDGLIYATARDVTADKAHQAELALAQDALRQAQKMEAMGQLTGGVAHDFNNLLTPIVGSLDLLQRKGLGGAREQRLIAGAMQSAERARTLVQRLLAFARRQPLQLVAVDVAELVAGMADLVASTTGPQIKVVVEADPALSAATADPNQLEMALLNLAVNARDAMPDGGTLRISADASDAADHRPADLRPGRYVRLSVADTGSGMDAATLARAVEPFFSTKGIGKGTGLGLSMVHGLVSQLGGALAINSRPGLGTNIELWLPEAGAAPAAAKTATDDRIAEPAQGTALLVDDEELVRISTADMLASLGYLVVELASAEEALRHVRSGATFDLVVTDHLMPGMNGTDLARAIRAERPGTPVLLVSGYAEQEGIDPALPRLVKPFRRNELAAGLARLAG